METTSTLDSINAAAERSNNLISEAQSRALGIKDQQTYQEAVDISANIKRAIKNLESVGGPLVAKTWSAYKEAKGLLDARLAPLQEAEAILKRGLRGYDDRIIEERRRAEEAERKAEAQRRAVAEAFEKAEAARKKAEEDKLQAAIAAEGKGNVKEAETILAAPLPDLPPAPPPVQAPPPPAPARPVAAGVSYRDNWKAEVTDFMGLVKAVADGKAWPSLLTVNQVALNALAKAEKEKLSIPGVRPVNDRIVSQRV